MPDFPARVSDSSGSSSSGEPPPDRAVASRGRPVDSATPAAAWPATGVASAPPSRAALEAREAASAGDDAAERAADSGRAASPLRRAALPASRSGAAGAVRNVTSGFGSGGLYISRLVAPRSAQRIRQSTLDALRAHGVDPSALKMVPDDMMHVTVVRSPNSLHDGQTLALQHDALTIDAPGSRQLKRLGDGIVLAFEAQPLHARWAEAQAKGAGWLYPGDYIAHVSVCYNAQHLAFEPIELDAAFPITLSGERAEPFNGNWVPDNDLD